MIQNITSHVLLLVYVHLWIISSQHIYWLRGKMIREDSRQTKFVCGSWASKLDWLIQFQSLQLAGDLYMAESWISRCITWLSQNMPLVKSWAIYKYIYILKPSFAMAWQWSYASFDGQNGGTGLLNLHLNLTSHEIRHIINLMNWDEIFHDDNFLPKTLRNP